MVTCDRRVWRKCQYNPKLKFSTDPANWNSIRDECQREKYKAFHVNVKIHVRWDLILICLLYFKEYTFDSAFKMATEKRCVNDKVISNDLFNVQELRNHPEWR